MILDSLGSEYRIPRESIKNEMQSLMHYIEWRLENSYSMILCKTVILADEIKNMMDKTNFSSYNRIKIKNQTSKSHLLFIPSDYHIIKLDNDTMGRGVFPRYKEIKSKQIPEQKPYVPLFDVEESYTSKLKIEPAKYLPSKIYKCEYCSYSCLDNMKLIFLPPDALFDHQMLYHGCFSSYLDAFEERIAFRKKILDPNYLGSFDYVSPRPSGWKPSNSFPPLLQPVRRPPSTSEEDASEEDQQFGTNTVNQFAL